MIVPDGASEQFPSQISNIDVGAVTKIASDSGVTLPDYIFNVYPLGQDYQGNPDGSNIVKGDKN